MEKDSPLVDTSMAEATTVLDKLLVTELCRNVPNISNFSTRLSEIARGIAIVLSALDLDLATEHLKDTPKRVARMLLLELCSGYFLDPVKILNTSFSEQKYNQMIFVSGIEVISLCAHHMIPFYGEAKIGYLPDNRVVGLSKLARITKVFAARLQVQETLTEDIVNALFDILSPKGAGVFIQAKHFCSCIRGVRNKDMLMTTVALRGNFLQVSQKQEFLDLCR